MLAANFGPSSIHWHSLRVAYGRFWFAQLIRTPPRIRVTLHAQGPNQQLRHCIAAKKLSMPPFTKVSLKFRFTNAMYIYLIAIHFAIFFTFSNLSTKMFELKQFASHPDIVDNSSRFPQFNMVKINSSSPKLVHFSNWNANTTIRDKTIFQLSNNYSTTRDQVNPTNLSRNSKTVVIPHPVYRSVFRTVQQTQFLSELTGFPNLFWSYDLMGDGFIELEQINPQASVQVGLNYTAWYRQRSAKTNGQKAAPASAKRQQINRVWVWGERPPLPRRRFDRGQRMRISRPRRTAGERCSCTTVITDLIRHNFDLRCNDTAPGSNRRETCVIEGRPWKHGPTCPPRPFHSLRRLSPRPLLVPPAPFAAFLAPPPPHLQPSTSPTSPRAHTRKGGPL